MPHAAKATLGRLPIGALCALLAGGCMLGPRPHTSYEANSQVLALNQLVIFQNSTGGLSYQTAAGRDVRVLRAPRVQGRACQHGISVPLLGAGDTPPNVYLSAGWGEGAYREAMADAREGLAPDAVLFDVRADLNTFAILTVYRRLCLRVDAAVAVPVAAAVPTPAPDAALVAPPAAPPDTAPTPPDATPPVTMPAPATPPAVPAPNAPTDPTAPAAAP